MFGHNEIVGQRYFREAPEARAGRLLVTSIFRTIQGEGPLAGMPAVFVRLAKCNLACSFCDTYFDGGDWVPPDELWRRVRSACGPWVPPRVVVFTGGEPLLQAGALGAVTDVLPLAQVETNGILSAATLPESVAIVVSPKCAERGGSPTTYIRPHPETLDRADCLKFVLSGDPASPYHEVPGWALRWGDETGRQIFVSPMAEYNRLPDDTRAMYEALSTPAGRRPAIVERTAAETISFWEPGLLDMGRCRRNYEYAARYVLERGLRLTVQMHLFSSMP